MLLNSCLIFPINLSHVNLTLDEPEETRKVEENSPSLIGRTNMIRIYSSWVQVTRITI